MAGPKKTDDIDMTSAGRFAWSDGDVEFHDEDGSEMTARQVKEAQLEALRAEVAEELPDDGE